MGNTTGTGNTTGAAGTTGTAGTSGSTTCGASFAAMPDGFVTMPAAGGACWHGYAFAGGDTGSTITPATFGTCGTPCALTMSGTVGAATMANAYAGVAFLGVNIAQASGSTTAGTIAPTGTGLTVTFTASTGGLPLRLQISSGATFWCYTITGTSPATVPYAMLNTACWDNSGTAYAKQPINNIQLVVPGGAAATPSMSVTLTGIREN